MTAMVQLDGFKGPIWINPLGVQTVLSDGGSVHVWMTGGYSVNLPVPEGSSLEGHARMVVGKLNLGFAADFR